MTLVEPVLMAPLRREWAALKASPAARPQARARARRATAPALDAFLKKLRTLVVMDPACGSGNFLYVSLQMLLDLEKEVITFATQLGFQFEPEVSVQQLRAIEINPYAFELAQVSVQIGFLQWRRDNGFRQRPLARAAKPRRLPERRRACSCRTSTARPRRLKEAQAGEHAGRRLP